MSFTTITTFQYLLPCKDLTYELIGLVDNYLKKSKIKDVVCGHEDLYPHCLMITSKVSILLSHLEFIEEAIPKWIGDIKEADAIRSKMEYNEVGKFLKSYKLPNVVTGNRNNKELTELLSVISDRYHSLVDDFSSGLGNVCFMGDIVSWSKMFKYIQRGEFKHAYTLYRSLDTCEREITPDSVLDLIS